MASSPTDYDALANQNGLTISDAPPAAPTPNYDTLAKQFGMTISDKPAGPDYDGLAKQFGLTISDMPPAPAPPLPPELAPDRPSLAQLRAEGKLDSPSLPPTDGPTIGPAQPSGLDYMRRFLFGGPNRETALGRAFPSMSGAKVTDTPTNELPPVAFEELIPSESQFAGANVPQVRGIAPNPLATPITRAATRGVAQFATELTKPQNLEIMAATEGMGALTPTAGYASVLGKGINTALGLYFANEMRKGATEAAKQAYAKHMVGDDEGAAQALGYGSLSALLGILGLAHGVRSVSDILHTQVPKPALNPEVLPPEAQPEPISAAPPPTVDVDQTPPPPPGSPPEPPPAPTPKPSKVDRVSPATPNPPTAAVPTTPESPTRSVSNCSSLERASAKQSCSPKERPRLRFIPTALPSRATRSGMSTSSVPT